MPQKYCTSLPKLLSNIKRYTFEAHCIHTSVLSFVLTPIIALLTKSRSFKHDKHTVLTLIKIINSVEKLLELYSAHPVSLYTHGHMARLCSPEFSWFLVIYRYVTHANTVNHLGINSYYASRRITSSMKTTSLTLIQTVKMYYCKQAHA